MFSPPVPLFIKSNEQEVFLRVLNKHKIIQVMHLINPAVLNPESKSDVVSSHQHSLPSHAAAHQLQAWRARKYNSSHIQLLFDSVCSLKLFEVLSLTCTRPDKNRLGVCNTTTRFYISQLILSSSFYSSGMSW